MRAMTAILILTGTGAAAHPGHIVDTAGHNHWVGGILLGAAGIAAAVGLWKGRKDKPKTEAEPEKQAA